MNRRVWYWICKNILIVLNDRDFTIVIRLLQFMRTGLKFYPLRWGKGQTTFSSFLLEWKLSIDSNDKLARIVADKVAVRDYVASVVGEWILIPHLGVYENAHDIDVNNLPEKFIIKANHGSGWNLLCKEKNVLTVDSFKQLNSWLKKNAYYLSRERQYKRIKPLLIIEELICDEPNDYKFFCFKGEVKAIQVDSGRFTNHERTIYDRNWIDQNINIRYKSISSGVSRPYNFAKMIEVAEQLSRPFTFARVDLYENKGRIYFGEITLCPGGAFEPFRKLEQDVAMRKLVLN